VRARLERVHIKRDARLRVGRLRKCLQPLSEAIEQALVLIRDSNRGRRRHALVVEDLGEPAEQLSDAVVRSLRVESGDEDSHDIKQRLCFLPN
jgi:hypothetical protein